MFRLAQPSDAELERLLEDSRQCDLSYAEVGATRNEQLPSGYRIDRYERRLGSEDGVFERAVDALQAWQPQVGAGVRIYPDARVTADDTVLFVLRAFGLWVRRG